MLCALNFKGLNVNHGVLTAICLAALLALGIDIAAVFLGFWHTAVASKLAFSVVFIPALLYSLRFIPLSIKAKLREKELQLELQAKPDIRYAEPDTAAFPLQRTECDLRSVRLRTAESEIGRGTVVTISFRKWAALYFC